MNWPAEGAEVKRLSNSRGDSPHWEPTDKSHRSSLHIRADNWAPGRSRSHRVPMVMRKSAARGSVCFYGDGGKEQQQLVLWFMQQQTFEIDLRLAVGGWKQGEESKYRIIWSHMSVYEWQYVKMSHGLHPIVIRRIWLRLIFDRQLVARY